MAEAVAVADLTPWTNADVERAIAFALYPYLSHEIGTICDDQSVGEVAQECARIAVETVNKLPKQDNGV